jgi:hypothetical protein
MNMWPNQRRGNYTYSDYEPFKDGAAWCAVCPGFIDLENRIAGWGDVEEEAYRGWCRRHRQD